MYKEKTKSFNHQKQCFEASKDSEYYALFLEQGCGKSKITIDTIGHLYHEGQINGALLLAPNGVHSNFAKEMRVHYPYKYYTTFEWDSSKSKTKRYTDQLNAFFNTEPQRGLKVLCMNIESIRTALGFKAACAFLQRTSAMVIVDESTIIKNHKAQQTKRAIELGKLAKYKRILSGTPVAQSPLDLWGQCQFLDANALPQSTYTGFKNQYAIVMLNKNGQRTYEQIIGYQNIDHLTKSIKPFSFRVMKKDCLDLPDKIYQKEIIPMTDEQEKVYREMKELAFSMLEDGLITSTNAVTTMLKLHQVVCGFIKDDNGNIHDIKNNRLDRLVDMCKRIEGKVIIWAVFKHNIKQIKEALGDDAVAYYGDTSAADRQVAIDSFNEKGGARYFIANEAASRGLTLVGSSTSIYYTNSFKLETRLQSEDRNHRIGQTSKVNYIDFMTPKTIDEYIVEALLKKQSISESVLKDVNKLKEMI